MTTVQHKSAAETAECFDWLDEADAEPFRDATHAPADFGLSLEDCWRGP